MTKAPDFNAMHLEHGSDAARDAFDAAIEKANGHRREDFECNEVGGKPKSPSNTPKYRLITYEDLKPSKQRSDLVKGLIPRVGITVIWGGKKCGKSFWTMDVMLHVALGWNYRGRKVQNGTVVYCAFEGQEGYGNRKAAFEMLHRERLDKRHRDCIDQGTNPAVPFRLVDVTINLVRDHKALMYSIEAQLGGTAPVAVVLDTLNRSFEGSESDDRDMNAYIRAADALREKFNCAVIIVHHCGVNETRPRGHTSLAAAAAAQIAVSRNDQREVITEVEFQKDGAEGEKTVSRLQVYEVEKNLDDDPVTSCAVVPVDNADAGAAKSSAKDKKPRKKPAGVTIARAALIEALDEMGLDAPTSNHIPSNIKVTTIARWREYAYRRGIADGAEGARQKAFKAAWDYLAGEGEIAAWDDYVWRVR